MKQNILIIDDMPDLAELVLEAINQYTPSISNVYYQASLIYGLNTFNDARRYISEHEKEIDIILSDYNLNSPHKGTEIFELINADKFKIFKVLHSITSKSSMIAQNKNFLWDYFCKSKDIESIHEALKHYEKSILNIKLFGNPNFRDHYFLNNERIKEVANKPVFKTDIRLIDILYAESLGNSNEYTKIVYRDSFTLEIKEITRTKMPIKSFIQNDLKFGRVNSSLAINLLWVSKLDLIKEEIHFLSFHNRCLTKKLIPTGLFEEEVRPYTHIIDMKLPAFFK